MTDSNVIRSTITKQPEPTKSSNLESKAASKDEFFKTDITYYLFLQQILKESYF